MKSAYLYSGTYTNVLTSKLLSTNQRELLLGARSQDEIRTALLDTPFAPHLSQATDIRSATMHFAVAQKERLAALAPDQKIISILFLRYDYANLKEIIRAEKMGEISESVLARTTHLGTITPPVLLEAVKNRHLAELSPELAQAYTDSIHLKHDEALGDLFDYAYLTHIRTIAKKYKRSFVERYAQILIDQHNIRTRLRVFTHPESNNLIIKSRFVAGGTISEEHLSNLETCIEFLTARATSREWQDAVALFVSHRDFSGIDKVLDNQLTQFLKTESLDIHAPTSLFAFFHTVMENVQFVDAIIAAQNAGLDGDRLRSIIRKSLLEYAY